jgi:hypothetical protein
MKRVVIIALIAGILLAQSALSFAGDRVRGRWEGVVIGLGAVSLYNLFSHGQLSPVLPPAKPYYEGPARHHPPVVVTQPAGRWEAQRVWVPERRETVWVPSYYINGYLARGHYEVRIYPGYYEDRRIWVEGPVY